MSGSSERREVALTRDISFKVKHNWFNNLLTFLDLGGCENVVNSNFAQHKFHLSILEDDSAASKEVQQAVNGQAFTFTDFVEVLCNFNGQKEKVKFFLVDNLPHPFLFRYPFFKKRGAIFDLTQPTVVLSLIPSKPSFNLLSTQSEGTNSAIFGANNIFVQFLQIYLMKKLS